MNMTAAAEKRAAVIAGAPFFAGLSAEGRRELARVCREKRLRRGEYLFHEGRPGKAMFLAEGRVQLHKNTEEGREIVIRVVGPGEVFGEVVLFEDPFYPVSARAVEEAVLLVFEKPEIHRLLEQPAFRNDFIAMLMARQRYLAERIRSLAAEDVERRFFSFLREQFGGAAEIEMPLSKKDVAAAIGTTPESLSRLLRRLRKAGRLSWEGRRIRLLRPSEET